MACALRVPLSNFKELLGCFNQCKWRQLVCLPSHLIQNLRNHLLSSLDGISGHWYWQHAVCDCSQGSAHHVEAELQSALLDADCGPGMQAGTRIWFLPFGTGQQVT